MADIKTVSENSIEKAGNFICGVVEGFYGRPWTTEQRKDLFAKMKKWGMDSYVYAPKDDYKHRAYWRELYTVEEAEHLTGLISAAKEHEITFYYAISPGLDITYSSVKEVTSLKRKLEQVSQFGCNAFALLFDDIEPEMSEADKEVFQSFAHAQVSVTNEMYHHLGQPAFMVCPTQYCATRATPDVGNSEYLNTLGSKLPQEVDIMWTGSKVITRTLSAESIEEISQVLRRPPVIWDNLHANDYDQKRIFLGPYSGRSPDLIPKLRGVVTNPNCEYGANFVAIHTLAQWSRCNVDAIGDPSLNESVSADIKLETEGASEEGPCGLPPNMYHPRRALKNAINEWLPEFLKSKPAWGPIAKPQQVIPIPVATPIIPSVNTCMSLTNTTTTTTSVINGSQLNALADVCCTVSTAVMNSLASENKIIPLEVKKTYKVSSMEAMDCNTTPSNSPAHTINPAPPEDAMVESPSTGKCGSCTMQVEVGSDDTASSNTHMLVDSSNNSLADDNPDPIDTKSDKELTYQDLSLLCDLFYLPFEHGSLGVLILTEFQWLRTNCQVLKCPERSPSKEPVCQPEVEEWLARAATFQEMANSVNELFLRLNDIANRELLHELYPYVWDIRGVVSLLNSFVQWSAIGEVSNADVFTSSQYTWFSKGWKEIFMSGNQEPWVFRGGLTADLQRLLPIDSVNDLFIYRPPEVPSSKIHTVRPYKTSDKPQVYTLAARTVSGSDLPESFKDLPGDSRVGGLLEASESLCLVVEDEVAVVGYAAAGKDANQLHQALQGFYTEMIAKYPTAEASTDKHKELLWWLREPMATPEPIHVHHPSVMTAHVSAAVADESAAKRLVACLLAALRSTGSMGVHTVINRSDTPAIEFFSKLGFIDLSCQLPQEQQQMPHVYMGRSF